MRLKSVEKGGYIVDQFREIHNHPLYSVKNREFQKLSRNLSLYHKKTIIDHSKVNIGPTKSFRIVKEYSNGYQNVGASLMEFKNFQRDVKCYIGDNDAAMFISNFQKLAETKGLYFAYEVDDTKCLTRAFWADKEAKSNYLVYGDTISFDPTYGTNKYFMVFTPFTGVDNNKKSVTFGAGLLSFEDEESFTWMFQRFLDAMGGKEPVCIITDQDPAIKNACPAVFKTARHKFCMWHIMQKMNDKVGKTVSGDTDFMSQISSVVWDIDLEPEEFEEKWGAVISEHSLQDNSWLSYMFGIRERWIPAYFRDLPLGCLLRTTQRS
ncbi:hypothetical protein RND81_14G156200 [Saponaria officinalis]|uniref:MULE transposase domain-containing protein n=1 Tax=Saponaria officinalis TaxID=3572 RepID=A0AAW1GQU0_SAPOF